MSKWTPTYALNAADACRRCRAYRRDKGSREGEFFPVIQFKPGGVLHMYRNERHWKDSLTLCGRRI